MKSCIIETTKVKLKELTYVSISMLFEEYLRIKKMLTYVRFT